MVRELLELDVERAPYAGVKKVTAKTLPRFAAHIDDDAEMDLEVLDEDEDRASLEGDADAEGEPADEVHPALLNPVRMPMPWNVDTQTLDEEEASPDSPSSAEMLVITVFDDDGYLSERTQYEGGILTQRERFTYNDRRQIERKVTEDPVNENLELDERAYDEDGRILRRSVTYSDGSQVVTDHLWRSDGRDSDGRELDGRESDGREEEEITRSDDGIESHYRRRYNEKGRVVEETELDPQTGEALTECTEYDANGNVVEIVHLIDGERIPLMQYTYDDKGRETVALALTESGETISTTYSTYDGDDKIEERIETPNDESVQTFEYDEEHRERHTFLQSEESQFERVTDYDDNGRLTMEASRRLAGMNNSRYAAYVRSSTTWYQYEP